MILYLVLIWLAVFYIFLIVNKSHVQSQTNNELILLTSVVCVSKDWYVLFFCPKMMKNMLIQHTGWYFPSPQRSRLSVYLETAPKTNNSNHIIETENVLIVISLAISHFWKNYHDHDLQGKERCQPVQQCDSLTFC